MKGVRYTLTTDGPTDVALTPLLSWLLKEQGVAGPISPTWADLRRLRPPPHGLLDRIKWALDLYPCDLLFVHRDAENQPPERRHAEIRQAMDGLAENHSLPPVVNVVPVRMTEAWLLFDERVLRRAAGNPNGAMRLDPPRIRDLEDVADPKERLQGLLRQASGLSGRRLKKFSTRGTTPRRISELLDTFAPLRVLPAFAALEDDVARVIRHHGWDRPVA